MRWIRFSRHGRTGYGILEGERVVEVSGDPFGGYERTARAHALGDVKIEVPVVPPTFYCVGLNYAAHIKEAAAKLGIPADLPKQPDVGYRAVNALVAHVEPVVIPADAGKVQYEGELAVVIGRRARNLSAADALSCVLGYTIGNDVSERTWQKSDRTLWRAKKSDTFQPMGPWIETDGDLHPLVGGRDARHGVHEVHGPLLARPAEPRHETLVAETHDGAAQLQRLQHLEHLDQRVFRDIAA